MILWGCAGLALGSGLLRGETPPEPPPCPDILIINSYASGYEWSEDALGGVLKELKAHYSSVEPVIQHLDTKRFPIEKREAAILTDLVEKCRLRPPRLIITMDDSAFDFLLKYRARLGPDIPVVFGGVNRFVPSMIAGQANITGVSEESDFQGTFELIRRLRPDTRKILVITTRSESGQASRRALEQNLGAAQSHYAFEYYDDWTNEQLIERVAGLPDDTVGFLLETSQDVTGRGNYNNLAFTAAMASRNRTPLFINSRPPGRNDWSVYPWLGLGGGMVVAGVHGEKVGELAVRVLSGERADAVPVVRRSPTVMEVDYRQMRRFGLSLSLLPPEARVINAPVNFYQINRSKIIWAAVVFVAMGVVIFAMFINILLRRRAERALREAQGELELTATAMSQASDVILILGPDSRVHYANAAYARITGNAAGQVRQQEFDALWSPRGANPSFAAIRATILEKGLWLGGFDLGLEGAPIVRLQVAVSPLRTASGAVSHYLFLARDVTLERKLEEQMRASQKMEAIGMLAGGIAHDFNNVLQVISGHCSLLQDDSVGPAELAEGLAIIGAAADRATKLTSRLLVFSRKQSLSVEPFDPNTLIADLLKILRRLIGEHIEISFVPLASPGCLLADKNQIEQVFLNLCVNARDAMPSGGRLTIELAGTQVASAGAGEPLGLDTGNYLRITVTDTGCGMPPEVVARVFEPFFTTKPVGQGTGLGLSVVYGIVQQHRGSIAVRSTPGAGTVFEILLPMEATDAVPSSRDQERVVPRGWGMVLLAEDDPQVQLLTRQILSRYGFEVVTASDGELAVALLDQHHDKIRLVVLDVLMPKLSGRGVYDHLKRLYPKIPVLFCSGYNAEMLPAEIAPATGLALLNKPYSVVELLEAVHRLLNRTT